MASIFFYTLILRNLKFQKKNKFNGKFKRVEFASSAIVRLPLECPPILSGFDQNPEGNAGAQQNSPPNLCCGPHFAACQFSCHTGSSRNFNFFFEFFYSS
jgi:hypothetical protein